MKVRCFDHTRSDAWAGLIKCGSVELVLTVDRWSFAADLFGDHRTELKQPVLYACKKCGTASTLLEMGWKSSGEVGNSIRFEEYEDLPRSTHELRAKIESVFPCIEFVGDCIF